MIHTEPLVFSCRLQPLRAGAKDYASLARAPQPARVKPVLAERDDRGRLVLSTATTNATIHWSFDQSPTQVYTAPIEGLGAGTLHLAAEAAGCLPFAGDLGLAPAGHAGHWKIVEASSFEPGEGDPAHAINGDAETFWHTRWSSNEAQPPHWLIVDLGQPTRLAGVLYTARADSDHGRVRDFELGLSDDGKNWRTAAKGRLEDGAEPQAIRLPAPATARFLKFVALSEMHGHPWATVAELDLLPAE